MTERIGRNKERGSRKYPDKQSVFNEINRRYREGLPLNYTAIRAQDDLLRRRCITLFGSYKDAVIAAGYSYEDICANKYVYVNCGKAFEDVLHELLSELNISFKRPKITNGAGDCCPDFLLNNNVWLDAKLNDYSTINRGNRTVRRYAPECRRLIIVHMYGTDEDRVVGKARAVHVNKFVKQLPKHRQSYYRNKFDAIMRKLTDSRAA